MSNKSDKSGVRDSVHCKWKVTNDGETGMLILMGGLITKVKNFKVDTSHQFSFRNKIRPTLCSP